MAQRLVYLDMQDGSGFRDISRLVKYDSLNISIRAGSDNFHYAQNTASFDVRYDSVLFPLLKANSKDILVRIHNSPSTPLFTGHIPMTRSYEYNGILDNTTISLEAVDDGDYLDKPVSGIEVGGVPLVDICYRGYQIMNPASPATSIVHQLAYLAGFTVSQIDSGVAISKVLNAFTPPSSSDSIKDLLDTLLFEYGYTLHFNEDGKLSPVKWITTATPTTTFNETNIIDTLEVKDSLKTYKGAEVIYYELAEGVTTSGQSNILLYRDSQLPYADDGSFLGYPIPNGYKYPPETNVIDETTGQPTKVFQVYEDKAIQYWTNAAIVKKLDYNYKAFSSDFSSIVATSGWVLDYDAGPNVSLIKSEFHNTQAEIVFQSSSATGNQLYYANVYGKVLYKTSERTSKIELEEGAVNINQYVSTFVFDQTSADALVKAMATQYDVPQVVFSVTADSSVAVGSLVNVVAGDGTAAICYVTQRQYDEKEQLWKYVLTTYSSATPTVTARTTTHASTDTATWMSTFSSKAELADTELKVGVLLSLSATNISRSRTNVLTPSGLLVSAEYSNGIPYLGAYSIDITPDGTTWQNGYTTVSGLETSHLYNVPATVTISGSVYYTSAVRVRLYEDLTQTIERGAAMCAVALDPSASAIYWGLYDDSDDFPIVGMIAGDYLWDNRTTAAGGGIIRYWSGSGWVELLSTDSRYATCVWSALSDMGAWATAQNETLAAASAIFQKLVTADAFIANLFAQQITVPDGGRIRYETGSGVHKRTVQLADEKIDWLDTPDTSPASPEVLRARIGRLGVGGAILMDGEFSASVATATSAPTTLVSSSSFKPKYLQTNDGTLRLAYGRYSDNMLVERVFNGTTWGVEVVISQTASGDLPYSYTQAIDGKRWLVYSVGFDLRSSIHDGTSWSANSLVASNATYPFLFQRKATSVFVATYRNSSGYLQESVRRTTFPYAFQLGTVLSSTTITNATGIDTPYGAYVFYVKSNGYLAKRVYTTSWSAEEEILSGTFYSMSCTQYMNGDISVFYLDGTGNLKELCCVDDVWQTPVDIGWAGIDSAMIQTRDGVIRYANTTLDSNIYLVERTLQRYAQIGAGIIKSNGDGETFSTGLVTYGLRRTWKPSGEAVGTWRNIAAVTGHGQLTCVTGENGYLQPWLISFDGSHSSVTATKNPDLGHTHSSDFQFRISGGYLQYATVSYTTARDLCFGNVVTYDGGFVWAI